MSAWDPPRLVTYYTDRVNVYESDLFHAIPAVPAKPAPSVQYIHRTTNTGNPYPVPWYDAGNIRQACGWCKSAGGACGSGGCGGVYGVPQVTVPYPTSGCKTCCGGGGC